MPIEDPTFGCGTYLPGMGPGNLPDFEGGGIIDTGGGVDPPPPSGGGSKRPRPDEDPGTPTGPGPVGGGVPTASGPGGPGAGPGGPVPTSGGGPTNPADPRPRKCACEYTGPVITPSPEGNQIKYTATFTGECKGFVVTPDDWPSLWKVDKEQEGVTVFKQPVFEGNCNGVADLENPCANKSCPDRVYYWYEDASPPPPPTSGPSTPTTPLVEPPKTFCYCVYKQESWQAPVKKDDGCWHYTVTFKGICKTVISEPEDPVQRLFNEKSEYNPVILGGGGNCKGGGFCGENRCNRKFVKWKVCPEREEQPPTGQGTIPGQGTIDFSVNRQGTTARQVITHAPPTEAAIFGNAASTGLLDLNNPAIASNILSKNPTGLQDEDIAFLTTPETPLAVINETGYTNIFANTIDSDVAYILKNRLNSGSWDSTRSEGVTPESVYFSLKSEVKQLLKQIRNYDGTNLTKIQIYNMIGTRILDGSIEDITIRSLQKLAKSSKERVPFDIIKSSINIVNEVAATALIDKNKFTLDPSKASGKMRNILPNWKTLATDIDQAIPISIAGVSEKLYVRDDNTFMTGTDLKIQDGNYVNINIRGVTQRLFADSELDHAFILPEKTRQQALDLLGADTGRTLEVSASASLSGIEFDYSLTAPRQNFYVLSAVLSSISTVPSLTGSLLLKDSTTQYDLVPTELKSDLVAFNEFIKYKANHRVFILDDEDLIFDYLDGVGNLTIKQTDIMSDSPKENKTIPLLTRQIPPYILIYPTNRSDYNLFNSKSQLISIRSDGSTIRNLRCNSTIVPSFSKDQTNKFVTTMTDGKTAVDVLGNKNTQTRITQVIPTDVVFNTGYRDGSNYVAADTYTRTRKKTGFRLVKEIITELATNYFVTEVGRVKSITEFDVFSRLYLREFNRLSRLENFKSIRDSIRNGLIEGVRVIPPVARSSPDITFRDTLLSRRKPGAPNDIFNPIKGTRGRQIVIPPTTTGAATRGAVPTRGTR